MVKMAEKMSAKIYPDSEKVIASRVHSPNFLQYEIMVLIVSARSARENLDECAHMEVGED